MKQELIEQEMNYTPMEFEEYVPKEYIRIEDGIIVEHVAGQKPEGEWIEVKEFRGTVGEPANWYDTDWKRIDDIALYETGVKELPLGKKVVEGKLEDVSQRELWLNGLISDEDFAEQKRQERDSKLLATDKYMLPDYPITEEDKGIIQVYRQTLRDLPQTQRWPDVEIPQVPIVSGQ